MKKEAISKATRTMGGNGCRNPPRAGERSSDFENCEKEKKEKKKKQRTRARPPKGMCTIGKDWFRVTTRNGNNAGGTQYLPPVTDETRGRRRGRNWYAAPGDE